MTSPNRPVLALVASDLGRVIDDVVFVGGQITELLVTDPAAVRVRPTLDVDVVAKVATRTGFHHLEHALRERGFTNDLREGAPVCRWISPSGGLLDVMSVDETVLGFSNRWYAHTVSHTVATEIAEGLTIRHPTAPVFLATKLEAYRSRGRGDLYGSHDLEDVIALVAGRPALGVEVSDASHDLRLWIGEQLRALVAEPDFLFAVQGALPDAAALPRYLDEVRGRFERLATGQG